MQLSNIDFLLITLNRSLVRTYAKLVKLKNKPEAGFKPTNI